MSVDGKHLKFNTPHVRTCETKGCRNRNHFTPVTESNPFAKLKIPQDILDKYKKWDSETPCFTEPQYFDQKRVNRVLFEYALGEPIHQSWRLYPICKTPKCNNPTHYKLNYKPLVPDFKGLPEISTTPVIPFIHPEENPEDIAERLPEYDLSKNPQDLANEIGCEVETLRQAIAILKQPALSR